MATVDGQPNSRPVSSTGHVDVGHGHAAIRDIVAA